jgi:hypothetical protein
MAETPNPKHLDKRTTERYLRNGELDEKAYETHLSGLPDVSEKSVPVETLMHDELEEEEDDELEDDEDEDEGDDEASGSGE